jgi:signal transduction histidine kinase
LYAPKFDNKFIDTYLDGQPVRQIQVPLLNHQKVVGHIFIAMSLVEANQILSILEDILFVTFPLILTLLFFIARLIAGRSIKPIALITETSSRITKDNLSDRIDLPQNHDELYILSKNINDLLDRIENAVEREKQFTSDASHELRTPLAVLKGTLEVLIRKPRNQFEYEEKINYCVKEVDRLNHLVDELLMLARFENQKQNTKQETVFLNAIILDVLTRYSQIINEKGLVIKYEFDKDYYTLSDEYLISIVIGNLISNAIKYSKENGVIKLLLYEENGHITGSITDNGIGIRKEDFDKILKPFFRSQALLHPEIKGIGLGLSIVNRLCFLLNIDLSIDSQENIGTTVLFKFP